MTKSMIKLLKAKKVNVPKVLSLSVRGPLSNLTYLAIEHMSNLVLRMNNLILTYSNPNGDGLNARGKSFGSGELC